MYLERFYQLDHIFTGIWLAEVVKGKKDQDIFYYLHLLLHDLHLVEIFKSGKLRVFPLSGELLKMFQICISVMNNTSTFLVLLS